MFDHHCWNTLTFSWTASVLKAVNLTQEGQAWFSLKVTIVKTEADLPWLLD